MKKITILVWNNFTNDKRVLNISRTLDENGYKVTIIAVKMYKGLALKEKIKEGIVYRIPLFSSFYSKRNAKASVTRCPEGNTQDKRQSFKSLIGSLFKRNSFRLFITAVFNWLSFNIGAMIYGLVFRADAYWCCDLDTLTVGTILGKITGGKVIFDSHELWIHSIQFESAPKFRKWYWTNFEGLLMKKADKIVFTTESRAKYIEKKFNIDGIEIVRNCPRFEDVKNTDILRTEFNIDEKMNIILYQGLIVRERGVFQMLEFVRHYAECAMVFIGFGKDIDEMRSKIKLFDISDRVFVKDAVHPKELLKYTASADIGCIILPNANLSYYYALSNKLFEYIMAGLCVIASDFPELRNVVCSNDVGIVVDPDNQNNINTQIGQLLKNQKLIEQYKENSLKIRGEYTWENEEKVVVKVLEDLLAK